MSSISAMVLLHLVLHRQGGEEAVTVGTRRGSGEGSVYKDSQGRWTAAVTLPPDPATGRARRKYFRARSRAEVMRRMRDFQVEVARGGLVATGASLTVEQWVSRWVDQEVAPARKPATAADYRSVLRRHIAPAIGARPLVSLAAADVRRLHACVAATGASPATVARVHRVLRAALSAAEREGLVARNVARLTGAPSVPVVPPRSMTAQDASRFLAARASRPDHARWRLSLTIGLRQGEALGLQVDHVHLDDPVPWVDLAWELRRVVWAHGCPPAPGVGHSCGHRRGADCPGRHAPIPPTMPHLEAHEGLWLLPPKTVGSHRRVALPPALAAALREHLQVVSPERFVFEAAPGVPVDPRADLEAWYAALQEEGLPRMRLHSARHTAATLLLEEGVPLRTAQEILGQTQALTTARYQHPSLAAQAQALTALEGAVRA